MPTHAPPIITLLLVILCTQPSTSSLKVPWIYHGSLQSGPHKCRQTDTEVQLPPPHTTPTQYHVAHRPETFHLSGYASDGREYRLAAHMRMPRPRCERGGEKARARGPLIRACRGGRMRTGSTRRLAPPIPQALIGAHTHTCTRFRQLDAEVQLPPHIHTVPCCPNAERPSVSQYASDGRDNRLTAHMRSSAERRGGQGASATAAHERLQRRTDANG